MMPNSMTHRLLIVDDNEAIHCDYRKILGGQKIFIPGIDHFDPATGKQKGVLKYEIDDAYQGEEAVRMVASAKDNALPYSLAFVDMRMPPGQNGLVTIEQMWEVCPDLEIVICTANSDSTWREINAYLGCPDNLLILKKPFDALELLQLTATLTRKFESNFLLRAKQERLEALLLERTKELEHASLHDELTGLPNRKKFNHSLEKLLFDHNSDDAQIAVMILDLDKFGLINDAFGDRIGDQVLKAISQRLMAMMLESQLELASRFDGDEFALILRGFRSENEVKHIADGVLHRLGSEHHIGHRKLIVNASMGISLSGGTNSAEMVKQAHLALRHAKCVGGCRADFFDPLLEQQVFTRQNLERRLFEAVEKRKLCLFYQPIFLTDTMQLRGVESLLRWVDGERIVMPGDIIPIAEENGLILPIGDFVIEEACREAAQWKEPFRIAINVSPRQFENGTLVSKIAKCLSHYQLHPDRLEIEITESILLKNSESTLEQLAAIQKLGVRIVLDDFGTGYSSLSYLQRFSFDKLKIDQSFIRNIDRPDVRAIVSSIAKLSKSLQIDVTAEGVETETQRQFVLEQEIEQIQGYLIGRPAPPDQVFAEMTRIPEPKNETLESEENNTLGLPISTQPQGLLGQPVNFDK